METPLDMFFDTSYISEASLENVRYTLEYPGAKYITDGVYKEIKEGYTKNPNDKRFAYIFKLKWNSNLKNRIRIISLEKCRKDSSKIDFSERNTLFKKNSLICSAYYAWLPYAINPSIITDPFRHLYNNALHEISQKSDPVDKIGMLMGELMQKEMNVIEQMGYSREGFTASALKRARKKKLKDFRSGSLKLPDYQTVLTALLYSCAMRKNVLVLTCDKDLVEIQESLIRSGIEKYTLNCLLTEKLKSITSNARRPNGENMSLCLTAAEIFDKLEDTFEKKKDDGSFCVFQVAYYDRSNGKLYGYMEKLPVWLMDFFLEYKLNLDCFCAYKELELKYPINYVMYPSTNLGEIDFDVRVQEKPYYDGFKATCEDICKYSRQERENPSSISGFI